MDGCKEMTDLIEEGIPKTTCYIQDYRWKLDNFDCILGYFCLCYLNVDEIESVLKEMKRSLRIFGCIIMVEPVLKICDTQRERDLDVKEESIKIRKVEFYKDILRRNKTLRFETKYRPEKERLKHDLMTFTIYNKTY